MTMGEQTEAAYYRNLQSQTKAELLGEIRHLRSIINERMERDKIEKINIKENEEYRSKRIQRYTGIRIGFLLLSIAVFYIGYMYSPGIIRLMALAFVVSLYYNFNNE
jgi:hypothetical protein